MFFVFAIGAFTERDERTRMVLTTSISYSSSRAGIYLRWSHIAPVSAIAPPRVEHDCVTVTASAASLRPYRDGNYLPFRRWNQRPTALLFPKQWRNIMLSKCLAIAFLATASITGAASAQTATNQVDSTTSVSTHKEGEWRGSKLAGVDV